MIVTKFGVESTEYEFVQQSDSRNGLQGRCADVRMTMSNRG